MGSDPATMGFDAVTMYLAAREIEQRAAQARVRKISQIDRFLWLFSLWNGHDEYFLCSLHPQAARFHRATRSYGNALPPSPFCMQLRKELRGLRLESCSTYGLERLTRLDFESGPGFGGSQNTPASLDHDPMHDVPGTPQNSSLQPLAEEGYEDPIDDATPEATRRSLIVELLPRTRNLVLLDEEDRVLGDAARTYRAGSPYELPVELRLDALSMPPEAFLSELDRLSAQEPDLALLRAIPKVAFGLSPQQARMLLVTSEISRQEGAGAALQDPVKRERLGSSWEYFTAGLQAGASYPSLYALPHQGTPLEAPPETLASGWPLPTLEALKTFDSWGALLEYLYGTGGQEAAFEHTRQHLQHVLARHRERLERRLQAQQGDLERADQADHWRHLGELLTAALHTVAPKAREVRVRDYTHPHQEEVCIELDPRLSPQENARRYFERYKKARRSLDHLQETMARTKDDLRYLDELGSALATARERDELTVLGKELAHELPADKAREASSSRMRGPLARPRRYHIDEHEILVGRNPRQNEHLTLHMARPGDLWLHARQIPGAHVIVRSRGSSQGIPENVVLAAASLAAAFSANARSARVEVDYTLARYVRKPPGSPAGFVTYSREKTVAASPEGAARLQAVASSPAPKERPRSFPHHAKATPP